MRTREACEPTLICLTPVKNESWILDRFLQCASTWADHIIVADQHSTDGSREIARSYDKVTLVDNNHPGYDEQARQKLLIDTARDLPVDGKRILMALDADEMLSANWMNSPAWEQLRSADPGTVLRFHWANIGPDVSCGWVDEACKPFGFVDDGSPHNGRPIHSPRVPVPNHASEIRFKDIKVLHYQYADWDRMRSKQRWYQVWERINNPEKRAVTIFRQYHHMEATIDQAGSIPDSWLRGYEEHGIDMRTIPEQNIYYWDRELIELFPEYGIEPFRKLNVWDADWTAISKAMGYNPLNGGLQDPRSTFERAVHEWLRRTQSHASTLPVRALQKVLQLMGW